MIFVTVGTTPFPFHRMREFVLALAADTKNQEHIIFQHGATPPVHMNNIENVYSMPFPQIRRCMSRASIVVCHGGPATIFQSLHAGKIPFVLPRSSAMGEHVDDHQVYFSAFMRKCGKVRSASGLRDVQSKRVSSALAGSPRRNNRYITYLTDLMQ